MKKFVLCIMKQLKKHKKYAKIILLKCRGGIAQLAERLNGIQEVAGSTPTISTIKNRGRTRGSFY